MSLKDKAIDIKGKKYVLVKDRIIAFNEDCPSGRITTSYIREGDCYEFMSAVTPDTAKPERYFTGHSQATIGGGGVNKTAAMENAETSAVGRALAMMGIGVIDSIASVDEIKKAESKPDIPKELLLTEEQDALLHTLLRDKKMTPAQLKAILNGLDGITAERKGAILTSDFDRVYAAVGEYKC